MYQEASPTEYGTNSVMHVIISLPSSVKKETLVRMTGGLITKRKALLDELKDIEEGENSAEVINRIKTNGMPLVKYHVIKSTLILNLIKHLEVR